MSSILSKFKARTVKAQKAAEEPDYRNIKRERTIAPHVVVCKVCEGTGMKDDRTCPQCDGSGRVIVTCEVTTYVTAYVPENNKK